MMEYTKRRNLNRGYVKLEVWVDAIQLCVRVDRILRETSDVEVRLRGQILDSAQSVSANIAEGYC